MILVASYCRVSTDKDDQANSFASQQRYFKAYIDRQPDWTLYRTYADEGITGTSTKRRAAFNRMIRDARMGRFQLILTKEVSRFSRNILDTISYTRELRQLGIGVLFMNDGINTMDPDAELRLSIMGSIAQEESRRTSSRVKWGQTRQMEQGVVFGRSLLGYNVKDGRLTVEPEGAEIVRQIFHKYGVEKKGTSVIARELREAGCRTRSGSARWSNSHIVKILKNEKYAGDLVQKKTITPDYLTHAKKYNHGEEALIVLRDHHTPIIDRETWDLVQSELNRRNRRGKTGGGHAERYLFSGKIQCGECGSGFISRGRTGKDGARVRYWTCRLAAAEGRRRLDAQGNRSGCNVGRMLREEVGRDVLQRSVRALRMNRAALADEVAGIALEAIRRGAEDREESRRTEEQLARLVRKKEAVLDAYFSRSITKEEMELMNRRYSREWEALQARREAQRRGTQAVDDAEALRAELARRVSAILDGGTDCEAFYKNLLERIVVYRTGRIEVRMRFLPQRWIFIQEGRRGGAAAGPF